MNRPESHLNLLVNQRKKTLIYSQAERCQGTVEGEVLSVFFLNKWLQETGCYVYQFPWVTLASDHQNLIASSNRNVLSHSSGGQKSKIKVSAGSWYLWSLQRRIPHCFFLASGAGLLARCWLFPGYLFWLDCSFIKYYSVVPSHTSFPPLGEGWRPE